MSKEIARSAARKVRTGPLGDEEAAHRRSVVIDVAGDEFIKNGYRGTSLDIVAKKSQVSKATIYREFGGKERLFQDFIAENITSFQTDMENLLDLKKDIYDVIYSVVDLIVEALWDRKTAAILALACSESKRIPVVGKMVHHQMEIIRKPLILYFSIKSNETDYAALDRLALHLMNMAVGGFVSLLMPPDEVFGNRADWAHSVTRTFLHTYPGSNADAAIRQA